ncbi:helix-turn-helix protein [Nocardia mexicana]|uniref:Helix-turn-helix protein n=2 Tax=Nocardia mexicana TaxID=279262 RepID=A0A370HG82_9NOCA|nr:helix-turn-helix protein [Nocardia mexicana]
MGGKPEHGMSTLVRRQLGRALRDARQALGYTLEQVAEAMETSRSTLGRLELGQNEKIRGREIEGLCRFYGLSDERTEYLKSLVAQAHTKSWWQAHRQLVLPEFNAYLEMESGACELSFYQPMVIPGLLQTLDYSKAMERPFLPTDDPALMDQRAALRIQRSAILTRRHRPVRVEFLLHEAVPLTSAVPDRMMAAQLRHVADMGTRENVTVRIVPFAAGFPTGAPVSPYIILDFAPDLRGITEPPVVYTENTIGTMVFEEVDDVERFRQIHERLRTAALDERATRDLLRRLARRYEQ